MTERKPDLEALHVRIAVLKAALVEVLRLQAQAPARNCGVLTAYVAALALHDDELLDAPAINTPEARAYVAEFSSKTRTVQLIDSP